MRTKSLVIGGMVVIFLVACKKKSNESPSPGGGVSSSQTLRARFNNEQFNFQNVFALALTISERRLGISGELMRGSEKHTLYISELPLPISRPDTSYQVRVQYTEDNSRPMHPMLDYVVNQGSDERARYRAPGILDGRPYMDFNVTVRNREAEGSFSGVMYGGREVGNTTVNDSIRVTEGYFKVIF
ncbi:MAG: hypothetical protein N2253_02265 [Bacteroidia bacterium]|nr:hypothetical protein [Bacteroidia bacterium]MCX7763700.1 hypothetical protein [Bacteroidia bacterium]MDW8058063.1 hypothetical protein [Bacteroidia bacterium]